MGAAASDYLTSYTDVQYGYMDEELGIDNFHVLIARGDFHRVSICLKKGLDPNGIIFDDDDEYDRQDTPIMYAVRGEISNKGTLQHVKTMEVLYKFGANVNKYNVYEQTPLYLACERNLLLIVQWLVTHGADVNKGSKVGVSPLLLAYQHGNSEIIKALLEHGARAIDVPKQFSSIKFPTIQSALDKSEQERTTDKGEEKNSNVTTSIKRLPSGILQSATTTTPSLNVANKPLKRGLSKITAAVIVQNELVREPAEQAREHIETYMSKQLDERNKMLTTLENERILKDQRLYRDKLANENDKRREVRRLQKAKHKYEKYVATIEAKRMNQIAPLQNMPWNKEEPGGSPTKRATTSQSYRQHNAVAAQRAMTAPINSMVDIKWTRSDTAPSTSCGRRTSTAACGARPTWIPQEIYATHGSTEKPNMLHREASEQLFDQCQQIYDKLQQTRDRKECLRMVFTAPDAEMLREQGTKKGHKMNKGQVSGGLEALPKLDHHMRPETAPV